MIGETVSHYRVLRKLGGGGMGVVYEAEDGRLGRKVALKFLPEEHLQEREARERFEREARAASALSHPNICSVFDVGDHEGRPFIVMELLEGATLKQRIDGRAIPTDELIAWATQIADALDATHSRGLIHRDIKPANVFVTTRGDAKVLDFGLAKPGGSRAEIEVHPESVTATEPGPLTRPGTTPGTVAYMSPEQMLGKPVDARTDLFSLGIVLYEMSTGKPPFDGDSAAALSDQILNREPSSPLRLNPKLPAELGRVVMKCLEKDRDLRYQSARELLADLRRVQRDRASGERATPGERGIGTRLYPWRWLVAAALGSCVVAVAGLWLVFNRYGSRPDPVRVVPFTSDGGLKYAPRLSTDGERVAYNWAGAADDNWDIYVKGVGQGAQPLRLTGHAGGDWAPAWSPDGREIAFVRELDEGAAIYAVPSAGGRERKLIDLQGPVWMPGQVFVPALSWSPDGAWLAFAEKPSAAQPARIFRMSLATLEKEPLTTPPVGVFGDLFPEFSPDGRQLAFVRGASGIWGAKDIWVQAVQGGRSKQITAANYVYCGDLTWASDGATIVFSTSHAFMGGQIFRVALSGGPPEPLVGVGSNVAFASVRGGRMVHVQHTPSTVGIWRIAGRRSAPADRVSQRLIGSNWWDSHPAYSPDGRRIAFESNRSGVGSIWISSDDGRDPAQLTTLPASGTPRWSPDGRRIVFDSLAAGNSDIYVTEVEGGIPRRVTPEPSSDNVGSFSRDGRSIYFHSDRSGAIEVWRIPAAGGPALQVSRGGGHAPHESRDGRHVYFARFTGGQTSIRRAPVDGGEDTEVMRGPSGWDAWAVAARGVYFLNSRLVLRGRKSETTIAYFDFESRRTVPIFRREGAMFNYGIAVSPDEQWILYGEYPVPQSELVLVENFR